MVEAGDVAGQHTLEKQVEAIGIGGRADFIEVKRGGSAFFEARLNPVDRARVAIEADPHRQRNAQHARIGHPIGYELFGRDHGFAVDGDGIGGVCFGVRKGKRGMGNGEWGMAEQGARSEERVISVAGEDQVDGEVDEAGIAFDDDREQVDQAFNVGAPGETGVEFAGAKGAVAGAVQH